MGPRPSVATRRSGIVAAMALGPTLAIEPDDSGDEIVCFDDLDPDPSGGMPVSPAQAVELLRTALLPDIAGPPPQPALRQAAARLRSGMSAEAGPHRHIGRAAGWTAVVPDDDIEVVVGAAAALLAPREPSVLPPGDETRVASLGPADWLGAIVGLVRAGAGASARPSTLVEFIGASPEVDGRVPTDEVGRVESAFEAVLPSWGAAGALDTEWMLTPLGRWALPRALARAWGGDLDAPSPFEAPA